MPYMKYLRNKKKQKVRNYTKGNILTSILSKKMIKSIRIRIKT